MAFAAVVAAAALSACAGSIRPEKHASDATVATHATTTPAAGGAGDYSLERSAMVWMRQYSPLSLDWQAVAVSPTGKGELTTLIGEISGAERTSFKLPARQLASLRRLLAAARGDKPPAKLVASAEQYTLHIPGRGSEVVEGPAPGQLRRLIAFLSALMTTYCC